MDIKTRYSGFIFKTKDALTSFIKPPQNNSLVRDKKNSSIKSQSVLPPNHGKIYLTAVESLKIGKSLEMI